MKNIVQGIYKIINCVNNKVYIGQSIDIEKRFKEHKSNINRNKCHPLYNSMHKHGIGNFEFIVLEEVPNVLLLDQREQYWMDYYQSYMPKLGYNICRESTTTRGYKHREETKKKFSETHKGKKLSEEHKRKFSWLGRKHKEETKLKIATKQKGKLITEEAIRKAVESNRKHWDNPIYIAKLSDVKNKLYANKPEIKQKISDKVKELWKNEEYRKHQSDIRKGKKRIFLDVEKVKDLYLTQNLTIQEIADNFGVVADTVSKCLKENNIYKPFSAYAKKKFDLDKVKNLYLVQNFTMEETAKLLNTSHKTLSNFIKENNIKKPLSAYNKSTIKNTDIHNLIDNNNISMGV